MQTFVKEYNALLVTVFGDFEPIFIKDFSSGEDLANAIGFGCRRIDVVSTKEMQTLSRSIGTTVVGYVDGEGYAKNHIPNRYMQELSGYSTLMGPAVICGWEDNDYAPLETETVRKLVKYLCPERKKQTYLDYFTYVGQQEFEEGLALSNREQYDEAHVLFEKSAAADYPDGVNALAIDYLRGQGVAEDQEKGLELMYKAKEMGSAKAIRNLGVYHLTGDCGLPVDVPKAKELLLEAAAMNERRAMAWLGYMYMEEEYGFANSRTSAYYLQEAIRQGEGLAWGFLGNLVGQNDYYPFQAPYVRYCFEAYMAEEGVTLEELIETLPEKYQEPVRNATALKPEYPSILWTPGMLEEEDPYSLFTKAVPKLFDEGDGPAGRQLLLASARQGCAHACALAGIKLLDYGQGEEFRYDETGAVTCFPVNTQLAFRYLWRAADMGHTDSMRTLFDYVTDEETLRKLMEKYVQLTGDESVQKHLLPNIPGILRLNGFIPWQDDEELKELERITGAGAIPEMTLEERIKWLEGSHWEASHAQYSDAMAWRLSVDPDDSQARAWEHHREHQEEIDRLLKIYRWIREIQE